jgi:hypothetical protein
MKPNTKPFSVEIKKSRVQGQVHHLPPRRRFEPTPVEPSKFFQTEEPQATAVSAPARRILPSIVEWGWSSAEPVEPIRRERSSEKNNQEQMELNLPAASSEAPVELFPTVPMVAEAVSEADMDASGEDNAPIHEVHPDIAWNMAAPAAYGSAHPSRS